MMEAQGSRRLEGDGGVGVAGGGDENVGED